VSLQLPAWLNGIQAILDLPISSKRGAAHMVVRGATSFRVFWSICAGSAIKNADCPTRRATAQTFTRQKKKKQKKKKKKKKIKHKKNFLSGMARRTGRPTVETGRRLMKLGGDAPECTSCRAHARAKGETPRRQRPKGHISVRLRSPCLSAGATQALWRSQKSCATDHRASTTSPVFEQLGSIRRYVFPSETSVLRAFIDSRSPESKTGKRYVCSTKCGGNGCHTCGKTGGHV